jgi:hypothetical protein
MGAVVGRGSTIAMLANRLRASAFDFRRPTVPFERRWLPSLGVDTLPPKTVTTQSMKRLAALVPLFLSITPLLAQDAGDSPTATPSSSGDAAAGAAGALFAGGCGLLYCGTVLAIYLAGAIWVTRDAKRRNSPNATLVTVLTWIPPTWLIGIIVHLVTRPKNGVGTGTGTTPPTV